MISEDALHNVVAQFLKLKLPGDAIAHHSPNEGKRGWKAQANLRRFSTIKGWPDIEIMHKGRAHFIELKAPGYRINGKLVGKGYLTQDQKACGERLLECGCPVSVCRSVEEVETALKAWGIMEQAE